MEAQSVLSIHDIVRQRGVMIYLPNDYEVFEAHVKGLCGNIAETNTPYFCHMGEKFMILNEPTYNFAKRLCPQRLDVKIGNPININENYVRNVAMLGRTLSGKTALIDQLRYGRMADSHNQLENRFEIDEKRLCVYEIHPENDSEFSSIDLTIMEMLIFVVESTNISEMVQLGVGLGSI